MDETDDGVRIFDREPAAPRAEVRVVVRSVEEIRDAILF